MARYEIVTDTDRSTVSRTTGKGITQIRVRHHKRAGARQAENHNGLLSLCIKPDGTWWMTSAATGGLIAQGTLPDN